MRYYRKSPGFSLVEMLVVIAVIGVIAAIAVPSISKVNKNSRKSTAMANAKQIANVAAAASAAGVQFNTTNDKLRTIRAMVEGRKGDAESIFADELFQVPGLTVKEQLAAAEFLEFDPNGNLAFTGVDGFDSNPVISQNPIPVALNGGGNTSSDRSQDPSVLNWRPEYQSASSFSEEGNERADASKFTKLNLLNDYAGEGNVRLTKINGQDVQSTNTLNSGSKLQSLGGGKFLYEANEGLAGLEAGVKSNDTFTATYVDDEGNETEQVISLGLVGSQAAPGDGLLQNGSFEDSPYRGGRTETPVGWTLGGPAGSGGLHRSAGRASDGEQYMPLGGWSSRTGLTLSQGVELEVGSTYRLAFDMAIHYGSGRGGLLAQMLGDDGKAAASEEFFIEKPEGKQNRYIDFVASSEEMTVHFTHTEGKALDLDLDNVTLAPSSEKIDRIKNGSFQDSIWSGSPHVAPADWTIGGPPNRGGLHRSTSRASDGNQYVALGGWSSATGMTLSQDVILEPGATYVLTFDTRIRWGLGKASLMLDVLDSSGSSVFSEEVSQDKKEGLVETKIGFTASESQMTIRFTHTEGKLLDFDIDNVKLF